MITLDKIEKHIKIPNYDFRFRMFNVDVHTIIGHLYDMKLIGKHGFYGSSYLLANNLKDFLASFHADVRDLLSKDKEYIFCFEHEKPANLVFQGAYFDDKNYTILCWFKPLVSIEKIYNEANRYNEMRAFL